MKTILPALMAVLGCAAANEPTVPDRVSTAPDTLAEAGEASALSPTESYIRSGIILLGRLHEILSQVRDPASAEQAVAPIMRLLRDFRSWGQGSASLPAMDDETRRTYELKYLPVIQALNERIGTQAERVAAAEYYGSRNLPAALVQLAQLYQP